MSVSQTEMDGCVKSEGSMWNESVDVQYVHCLSFAIAVCVIVF